MRGVGNQGEGEGVFFDKLPVGGFGVGADADYLIAVGKELGVVVAQVACLGGAARSRVFGVEIERDALAGKVAAANFGAVLVGAEQVRHHVS